MTAFLRTNIDFSKNFIRGAARLVIADLTTPFAQQLSDVIRTTTAGNASEVQTATITGAPTGGTFTLSFKGYTTPGIAFNATGATVQAALVALSSVGTGGVTVTGSASGPYVVTFANQLSNQSVPLITPNSSLLTGGTTPLVTNVRSTPGVGQYDAQSTYTDLGATKGGITVMRNNSESTFSVDQINADIMSIPTAWQMTVAASVAQADIDTLQYVWEGGTISLDIVSGERTLPLGTPLTYRQKRLVVLFQRQSVDNGVTPGLIRGYAFRITQRTPQESTIVQNSDGDQVTVPFTWNALADQTVTDDYARFGSIIDQA